MIAVGIEARQQQHSGAVVHFNLLSIRGAGVVVGAGIAVKMSEAGDGVGEG